VQNVLIIQKVFFIFQTPQTVIIAAKSINTGTVYLSDSLTGNPAMRVTASSILSAAALSVLGSISCQGRAEQSEFLADIVDFSGPTNRVSWAADLFEMFMGVKVSLYHSNM